MSQTLTALDDGAKEVSDIPSHGKLSQADQQRHQRNRDQKHDGSTTVDDILDGASCDDGQRHTPHIERQVLDSDQPLLHARQVVLNKVGRYQRQHQHQEHLVHDHPEGGPEVDIHTLVDEREHNRNGNHGHQIAQKHIGRHRLQIAPQLPRHHRCRTGSRTNHARQDALHQDQVLALHVKAQDQCHQQRHQHHLEHRHPQVPHRRAHLVEVHTQKRREQDQAHEQRQDGVEDRLHHLAHWVKSRNPIEYQIDDRAPHYRAGQRPILQKCDNSLHSDRKITAKSRLTEHIQNSFSSPTTSNCIIPLIFLTLSPIRAYP